MSGQEVTVPLATHRRSRSPASTRRDHVVGVLDTTASPPGARRHRRLPVLAFFAAVPSRRFARSHVIVESPATLGERARSGAVVPVDRARGPVGRRFLRLDIPGGRTIEVEIDMGSDSLILDESLADEVGVDLQPDAASARSRAGRDGSPYTRYLHASSRARPRDRRTGGRTTPPRGDVPADHLRRARRRRIPPALHRDVRPSPRARDLRRLAPAPSRLPPWST